MKLVLFSRYGASWNRSAILFADEFLVSYTFMCTTCVVVPDEPGHPHCEGATTDSITLSWEPPTNDGGKPVKGYIVEKREHGSELWTKYV